MGGDKLMPAVSGIEEDSPQATRIAKRRGEIFKTKYLPHLKPFPDARRLVAAMKARGFTLWPRAPRRRTSCARCSRSPASTSLLDAATSSDDAEESKPEPDIIQAALRKAQRDAGRSRHDRRHAV